MIFNKPWELRSIPHFPTNPGSLMRYIFFLPSMALVSAGWLISVNHDATAGDTTASTPDTEMRISSSFVNRHVVHGLHIDCI